MTEGDIYRVVVDSLSTHVAILDENGQILETNRAWQEFGLKNGMKIDYDSVGTNYLEICRAASRSTDDEAARVADGIVKVLSGELQEFFTQYPCHSPDSRRWYAIRVVPYRDEKVNRVIVTHENITPIMEVQETLRQKENELSRERESLEETNIALRVLIRQREADRKRIEDAIYMNVERLVLPYFEKIKVGELTERHQMLLDLAENNLRDIVSPFLHSLTALSVNLTPQEIEVAHMVRGGRSSKEIAEILNLSVAGVDFHRKNLRRKLGISNTTKNLRSHLLTLE